jgi:MFS family permease
MLAVSYVRRFGNAVTSEVGSPQPAILETAEQIYLAAPLRSRVAAIAWKQFRESGPIALVGASAALAIALMAAVGGWAGEHAHDTIEIFGGTWLIASVCLGGAAALAIGIGVFLRDLEPGLNAFWRSRPIPPDQWYWTRFVCGLTVIFVAFQLPGLFLLFAGALTRLVRAQDLSQMATTFGTAWMIFVASYVVAVAVTCLVRHAMFAGILTVAATYFGALAVVLLYLASRCFAAHRWTTKEFESVDVSVWIAGLLFDTAVGSILGWLAVRYDWGRKM